MCPPFVVIYKISEPRGIYNGKVETNAILFDIYNVKRNENMDFSVIGDDEPAPILSMATVLGRSAEGGRGSLGG